MFKEHLNTNDIKKPLPATAASASIPIKAIKLESIQQQQ